MTVVESVHDDHGATFDERGSRRVTRHYGRPASAHRAVRNGVGVVEMAYGVLAVSGDDRVEFVDNVVSNRVPDEDGWGTYALLLDPQGRIETEMYVYNAAERLLVFTPPGEARSLADDWAEKVFIQDVEIEVRTDDFGVFGVHGPKATGKIASVLHGVSTPEAQLSFVRGELGDTGTTILRTDAPTGEEGYEVVCAADDAPDVFDTLVNRGMNAVPFGYDTWESLTLEAGTPLFETELEGTIPNVLGLRNALDFEKGCYVGQEVVARVENLGQPNERLAGLSVADLPASGAAVFDGDSQVGEVTRAVESPTLDEPIALTVVDFETAPGDEVSVRVGGKEAVGEVESLPFVEGSELSARLPSYPE
jgi:aminomethyltransferase